MSELKWKDKITHLACAPGEATKEDVEKLAGNLSYFIRNAPSIMEQFGVIDRGAATDAHNYDGGATFDKILKMVDYIISVEGR